MAILKQQQAGALVKEAVVLDLGDLVKQAERLQEAARAKARTILVDAQAQADELIAGAEAKGLAQGRAQGIEEGKQQGQEQGHAEAVAEARAAFEALGSGWSQALDDLESQRIAMQREAKSAVLQLAIQMAEKILHRTIELDEQAVVGQVEHALSHVLKQTAVRVHIHPEDKPAVNEAMPGLRERFADLTHLEMVEDEQVQRAGCVVMYGRGRIDATIQTQLDRLVEVVMPASEAEPAAEEAPEVGGDGTAFADGGGDAGADG